MFGTRRYKQHQSLTNQLNQITDTLERLWEKVVTLEEKLNASKEMQRNLQHLVDSNKDINLELKKTNTRVADAQKAIERYAKEFERGNDIGDQFFSNIGAAMGTDLFPFVDDKNS